MGTGSRANEPGNVRSTVPSPAMLMSSRPRLELVFAEAVDLEAIPDQPARLRSDRHTARL